MLINRTLRNTSRVARNDVAMQVAEIQQDASKTFDDVKELVAGARGRANVLEGGDINGGIWTVGQSQGLIHELKSCKDLVADIAAEAESIMGQRLASMLG